LSIDKVRRFFSDYMTNFSLLLTYDQELYSSATIAGNTVETKLKFLCLKTPIVNFKA